MAAITIHHQSAYVTIPQAWNELTPQQCGKCSILLRKPMQKKEQQLRLLFVLMGVKWYHFRTLYYFYELSDEFRYFIATEGTAFLYGENTLTKNPFPAIGKARGPKDELAGITGKEFAAAEEHLFEYLETRDVKALRNLAAALWRPANQPLIEAEYLARARKCKLPLSTLYAIQQFYEATRKPYIDILQEYFPDKETAPKTITGWVKVFYALAENITAVDEVANQSLDRIIGYLIHQKEDNDAMQERLQPQQSG